MHISNVKSLFLSGAVIALLAIGSRAGAAPVDNRDLANHLAAQFVLAENTMNVALFDDIFTTNYIQHNPDVPPGLAGVKQAFASEFKELAAAHVSAHAAIEDVLVDGDRVVLRQILVIEKGGKRYQARSIDEWRIVDGRFGEHWDSDEKPRPVNAR